MATVYAIGVIGLTSWYSSKATDEEVVGWYFFEEYPSMFPQMVQVRGDGAMRQRLLAKNEGSADVKVSPDNQWLLFNTLRPENGGAEIYRMRLNHSHRQNLSNSYGGDFIDVITPDGQWIIFTSERDGNLEIYRMNLDGSEQQNLSNHPMNDWNAEVSPDGQWIVFVSDRDGVQEIYRMRLNGSEQQNLTNTSEIEDFDSSPVFTPDGEWVVFASNHDLHQDVYKMRLDGSQLQNLSKGFGEGPRLSLDKKHIVFVSIDEKDGIRKLYQMNMDGSNVKPIKLHPYDQYPTDYIPLLPISYHRELLIGAGVLVILLNLVWGIWCRQRAKRASSLRKVI
jgi:tol-pal system beta propeller repeat protein TolB